MTRVVADTNVYVSALMFGGLPAIFLDLAFLESFTLVASTALLDELDEKLRLKFGLPSSVTSRSDACPLQAQDRTSGSRNETSL